MSEVSIVLYAPPLALLDALRDKKCFVTSSYGNSIDQRDAAHRRELILKEEIELLTVRHLRTLAREETLEKENAAILRQRCCPTRQCFKSNRESKE